MLFDDTYKTIVSRSDGLFKDRGSRFVSLIFPVTTEAEIKIILTELRKKYHDASHHCFAYRLGFDKYIYKINDDGEPSGTAGNPIFGQIRSHDLTNILIVVIRYFGGTLLGISGLINAYRSASNDALNNAQIVTRYIKDIYEITFGYAVMNEVMKILKEEKLEQLNHLFEENCLLLFSVRKRDSIKIYEAIKKINGLQIKYIKTRAVL